MEPLSPAQILRIWERGALQAALARPLTILAEVEPAAAWADLAALPLGRRDGRLLAVREGAFGDRLQAVAACAACGQRLELTFSTSDLQPPGTANDPPHLRVAGLELRLRLPDTTDLAAAAACPDVHSARRVVARRCVVEASRDGVPIDPELLPDEALPALARELEMADPAAEQTLEARCEGCGAAWEASFDIGAFLWAEIEAEARRLLHDVHRLARGYGWREADILALSPLRRSAYLELLA